MNIHPCHLKNAQRTILPAIVALITGLSFVGCSEEESNDDCVESECNTPPTDRCEGDVALVFEEDGICVADSCRYAVESIDCAASGQLCDSGRCVDPA